MANFIAIIDPDTKRRGSFIEKIKPLISPVEGLVVDMCSIDNFSAIWAANPKAPVSCVSDTDGAGVMWGQAIRKAESARMDIKKLRELWKNPETRCKETFDGFYAAVVYLPAVGLTAGADLLGVFPVYYWSNNEVLLVGSSMELFRYYPAFGTEFDPAGLVGILLTMHLFDGRTLQRGVRRLSAGHLLQWQKDKEPAELQQYKIAVSQKYFSLPFSAHVDILDRKVNETITRHVPVNGNGSILLSGGLDSRMLAGYLSEKNIRPSALTLGKPSDLETQCAIPVAKALGMEHRVIDVAFDQYSRLANLESKWGHNAGGFNNIINWALQQDLTNFPSYIIMGHVFDAVIGTRYINWAYNEDGGSMSFESFFSNLNNWGISPHILRKLLRREIFDDLVNLTISKTRSVYESFSDLESQRVWCFNLYHRQRFHVGAAAWVLSFGAWPIMPALDRELLEAAGAMPASTIAERRGETELLCKRFPQLATLSLDRNSYNTEPLQPRLRYQVQRYFYNHIAAVRTIKHIGKNKNAEHRFYFRVYDFNNPGWQAVRRQAEPYREKLYQLFHKDTLDKLLPKPNVHLNLGDGIIDASGLKTLLGLMLWSKDHL